MLSVRTFGLLSELQNVRPETLNRTIPFIMDTNGIAAEAKSAKIAATVIDKDLAVADVASTTDAESDESSAVVNGSSGVTHDVEEAEVESSDNPAAVQPAFEPYTTESNIVDGDSDITEPVDIAIEHAIEPVAEHEAPITLPNYGSTETALPPTESPPALPADVSAPEPTGLPAYVEQALVDIASAEGFTPYEMLVNPGSKGDGFVGEIHRVTLAGVQTRDGVQHADAELRLIVKLPPSQPVRRRFAMKQFEREILVYSELLPTFAAFQLQHGLRAGQHGFHAAPRCYYAHYDEAADRAALVLEDLTAGGYAMENKTVPLKFEYARAVLEKLAEFHGISLAMKQQCPERLERFRQLGDVMTSVLHEAEVAGIMAKIQQKSVERALLTLEASGETALAEKVQRFAGESMANADRYLGDAAEPYSVVTHGDCWINNMMFKHQSGKPVEIELYDWQAARYGSPVLDIVFFLFISTDAALRGRYYDDLIQAYHHALRAQLDRLGADVNELLPFTALLRQLKTYGRFALDAALMIVPITCVEKSNLRDLDDVTARIDETGDEWDGAIFDTNATFERKYNERMGGVLRDMNRKGFF